MGRKVALFVPCFVDQLNPQVAIDTVRVLERAGCEVEFRREQTCCGQPAFNAGHWQQARPVAERFLRVFESAEAVVCPSGSCTSMVRKFFPELLQGTPMAQAAGEIGPRVFELAEFLVNELHVTDLGASFPHRVAWHDACHLTRELGIRHQPRELLRHVRGLELLEIAHNEECCGFGGTFAVKFSDISAAMGDRKVLNAEATGAEYLAASDPSCLLHIGGMMQRMGSRVQTIHLATILAQEAK